MISRSATAYVNPLVTPVKKKEDVRVCLDACRLNKVLIKDHEKPPNIQEIWRNSLALSTSQQSI